MNFSKTHLHNPNIAEDILKIIRKYDIESRYIEIEMTEMSDFNDYEAFRNLVNKLKANGVTTSIDDFGTGYSSLNLLTDFMFDIVKLDKSFIDNIIRNNSKTDEIVVRNIVRMINELKMTSIAEGVETAEQADFLEDIGCGMVQGYLFDRPLPEEEFINRLKTRVYKNVV
ncbi:MAG: EAL domain-containing protein [Ruminiclostridium sp.]|nr:EAL domain-containing protein [Ruminiclostridium sp.]